MGKPGGALGTCSDMPDVKLKEALNVNQDVSCRHAVSQGACADAKVKALCCQSCTVAATTPAGASTTCQDVADSVMQEKFGSTEASCPDAANAGACQHAEIAGMCCASCQGRTAPAPVAPAPVAQAPEMVAKFESNDASCPDAAKAGACKHQAIADMCCASCKGHTSTTCQDAADSAMQEKFGSNGASCSDAANAGACDHAEIADMCCASCASKSG